VRSLSGFITWQPVLTDHQAYTYLAIQKRSGLSVLSFVTAKEDDTRRAQGWTEARVDALVRVMLPKWDMWAFCWAQLRQHRNAVHLFASPFQQPRLMLVLLLATYMGRDVYLISEPYSPIGDGYYTDNRRWIAQIKSKLRPTLYRLYALLLGRRIRGVFAISKLAERQYQRAGISAHKLLPFGYFVPKMAAVANVSSAGHGRVRCVFVGSLIRRKGIDLLVAAMAELHSRGVPCDMDVYGPGDSSLLEGCIGIRYCGTIPFGAAQNVLMSYDLFVLPSRHDGWGVVVNEAICAGLPVLCSDCTGAGDIAAALGAARLFKSEDVCSLVREMEALIVHPDALAALKRATVTVADQLQPEVAADYLLACVRAPQKALAKLPSPWYGEPKVVRYFPSFKAFGDLVIACHHLCLLDTKDDVLLCADHLRPLLDALGYSRPVKWLNNHLEGVPALFDIRKQGTLAAARSAWSLRRSVRDATSSCDTLVFDRVGWRQRWISAERPVLEIASGEKNIYLDYEKFLGLQPSRARREDSRKVLKRLGIFPDSRVASKQIPQDLVTQMADTLRRLDIEARVVRTGALQETNTFEGLVANLKTWDAVISADSLPAHLAEYLGLPIFVVTSQPNPYWLPKSAFIQENFAQFSASVEMVKKWVGSLLS